MGVQVQGIDAFVSKLRAGSTLFVRRHLTIESATTASAAAGPDVLELDVDEVRRTVQE